MLSWSRRKLSKVQVGLECFQKCSTSQERVPLSRARARARVTSSTPLQGMDSIYLKMESMKIPTGKYDDKIIRK